MGNYKVVHLWQLAKAHSFSENQMYFVFVSDVAKLFFQAYLAMLGSQRKLWMIFMFFGFVFYMLLVLPISFKLEARSWQPVGQLSLWKCFVWPTGCFLKIWISCQHLKNRTLYQKKKKIQISCFSWKIGRSRDIGAGCTDGNNPQELSSSCLLWTRHVAFPMPHPHWPATLPASPSQDSTENEAPKYLNH